MRSLIIVSLSVILLICTSCLNSTTYEGGYITRVRGKITHAITGEPVSNYKIYVVRSTNIVVGLDAVDSAKTNSKGDYEILFVTDQDEYKVVFPGVTSGNGKCSVELKFEEGADIRKDVALIPLQPLLGLDFVQKAQEVGATEVTVTLYENKCRSVDYSLDPTKPINMLDVAPNTSYSMYVVFRHDYARLYEMSDSFFIETTPYIYVAK